jgi:lipopolysaccharide/colanic/teichoic acid biosynthesis glycosyltransferase
LGSAPPVKLHTVRAPRRIAAAEAHPRTRSLERGRADAAGGHRHTASARARLDEALRRTFDILVSAVALALLTPLFAVVALFVKVTSPGPVFYHQIRVGQERRGLERRTPVAAAGSHDRRGADRRAQTAHGRLFSIHKIRTMVVDAEEYGPQWSSRGDPRITFVGRFLRLTRLDETPQFLNVLLGHMSVIGPRPERPYFVEQFAENIPNYVERLRVRPGITGRAQVVLDYDANIDDVKKKLEHDLEYVRNRSIRQDLAILAKTVAVVLTGKGAC